MGSCGPLGAVEEEPSRDFGSGTLLDVGAIEGNSGSCLDCLEMGVFANVEERNGYANPDLGQFQCSGVVSHLLDCNEREADYNNVEKNLYSEQNMFIMNSDTAVMNQSDWFGINGEVPVVGVDGIEDVKRTASKKVHEMKFGDSMLCSRGMSYQLDCLGSTVDTCIQKEEESKFEEIMLNLVQKNVETPVTTSSLQIVPPGDCIQQKDTENNIEFSEEPVIDLQGAIEDKRDSLARMLDGLMSQSPHKEDKSCNTDEETPKVASDCNEVSDSFHLPHLAADSSSGRDLVIDDLSGAQISPTVVDFTRLADIEGDGNLTNCSNTVLTSVRRSTRRSKASKMPETNETAAGCRKASKNKLPRGAIIRMPLKIFRKKRSCSARRGRSFVWGLLGNVMQVFEENDGTQNHDTLLVQVENDRSRKRRGSKGNPRFQMAPTDVRSHLTEGKCSTANGSHVRLKFKLGGKEVEEYLSVVHPQVLDPPASLPAVISKHVTEIDSHTSSDVQELDNGLLHILEKNVHDSRQLSQFTCLSENLGVLDSQQGDKDLESTVTQDSSVGITFSDCPQLSCQREFVVLEETIQNRYLDLGTSPDSEVINSIQDVGVSSNAVLTSSQAAAGVAAPGGPRMNTKSGKKHGKVKGTTYCLDGGIVAAEEKLLCHGKPNKTKRSAHKPGKAKRSCNAEESNILETTGNASGKSSTLQRQSSELLFLPENSRLEESFDAGTIIERCELSGEDIGLEHSELGTTDDLVKASKSMAPKRPSKSSATNRRTCVPDSGRSRRKNACEWKKASVQKSVYDRNAKEEDIPRQIVHDEENNQETGGSIDSFSGRKMHSELQGREESSKMNVTDHDIPRVPGKSTVTGITSEDVLKSSMIANGLAEQVLPPRKAWVLCDDCNKWRCISATLADSIEATNCRWTCKDNMDKAFTDCSIPQEKTNAEINEELEISDEEDAYGANVNPKRSEGNQLTVAQQAHWKPIDSNLFLHRSRKNQTIDEIMVCHCKPPQDGCLGCGDECLNRMLNIECVRGTCPCGDFCSNQQFQKRKYAKLECFRCGKKGHGLQLLENVSEGKFLIEYVGEVLDLNAYEARQREYAARGQRHFYFMTLNGSEVIDACAKGNLGRFINHSCDPNCRTEKWMVNGEVCIGLFAIRDIKKGEELTFDYNYVRVFGAAAKKCVCGSSECRGYIGGDPLNTETIVQSDSDDEFPEPKMVNEECMKKTDNFARITEGVSVQHSDMIAKSLSTNKKLELSLQKEDNIYRSNNAVQHLEAPVSLEDKVGRSVSIIQPIGMSSQTEVVLDGSLSSFPTSNVSDVSLQKEDTMCKNLSSSKSEFTSPMIDSVSKSSDGCAASNSKPMLSIDVEKPNSTKAHRQMKSFCSSSSIKKGKAHSHLVSANRPEVFGNKPKKVLEGAVNNSLKGVELKLNELLDTDGGISKRKDFTKGYLKLLNFTANINGEAVQSIRDLSIILDALLKTRSRIVLVDIINKNGLQMLHNIMKQNRNNFNRTPILRKLLKVVKFLAEKEILTLEHINSGPHCHGVESFRESIFQLAKHDDIKVHQIARIFRDRWFPRTSKRGIYSDKDDVKLEFQGGINCNRQPSSYKRWHGQDPRPIEATDCSADATVAASQFDGDIQNRTLSPSANYFITNSTKSRKCRSRWDQPKEVKTNVWLPELMHDRKTKRRFQISPQQPEIFREGRDEVAEANIDELCNGSDQPTEVASDVEAMLESCDCAPPGFSFPLNSTLTLSDGFSNTTSNLPPQTHDTRSDWEVNMGCHQEIYLSHLPVSFGIPMVFVEHLGVSQSETMDSWTVAPSIPFHSFPPLPPYPRERRKIQLPSAMISREHDEEVRKQDHCAFRCEVDPSTSATRPPDVVFTGPSDQHMVKRKRSSSDGLGKRYFRKQKWNCWKCPPWIQRRMDGNICQHNSRSSASNMDLVNLENEKGGFCTENVNGGGENVSSTYHRRPEHHHDH